MINKFKPLLPHLLAIFLFIIASLVYFYPQLEGYKLHQGDNEQATGMSKEICDFRAKYKTEPLWTGTSFSGMPAYQISTIHPNYIADAESRLLLAPLASPMAFIVVAMLAFYVLLICFDISPWISIIGSLAFGLASLNMLYLAGGHNTKVHAIALLPLIIGSVLLAYRKNLTIGALLLTLGVCLQVSANHLQMTYYGLFLIGAIGVVEFVIYLKQKQLVKFGKITGVLIIATFLGLLPCFSNLYTTYEYGKYSTRGKSELTVKPAAVSMTQAPDALNSDYIKQYSLGYGEIWSVIIPDAKGGSGNYIGSRKDAKQILENTNPEYKEYVAQSSSYWGEQLFSGGAFYFGVTMFALFVLGMVFISDPIKWAFLAASVLAVFLSWKSSSVLDFFIDYFPMFNKFRDTKMMLIILQLAFPFVGMVFVKYLTENTIDKKKLMYTAIAVNGLLLLFYVMPSVFFDFVSSSEAANFASQRASAQGNPDYLARFNNFIAELENARIMIFKTDVLRSLFFSLLVFGAVYLFVYSKLKKNYLILALGLLILADMWMVDKRYLNNKEQGGGYQMWVKAQQGANPFRAGVADNEILANEIKSNPALANAVEAGVNEGMAKVKEKDAEIEREKLTFRELGFNTNYRVLTLNDPISNGQVSYFHKSIGGYHGAKLKKYQELVDFYISQEINTVLLAFKDSATSLEKITAKVGIAAPVLNMLNTKYFIYSSDAAPIINNGAFGNCWFVKKVEVVENADAEILSLGKVDLKTTAVINKKDEKLIGSYNYDSTANIQLVSYKPNSLVYKTTAKASQFAVFSEIYYPKGWNAYVDGKLAEYASVNYLLRGMNIPAGEHSVEFRFEPKSYLVSSRISSVSSVVILLLVFAGLGFEVFKSYKKSV
jgi:hypothetical protein